MSYHLHHTNDDFAHLKGLRAVASLELLKGAVVVIGTLALLRYVHRDVGAMAAALLDKLHVPPGASIATHLLAASDAVTPGKIKGLIAFACLYSAIRFTEGYGLWLGRVWAEWFAIISGTVYLPFEVYELVQKVNWLHCLVLAINVAIVLYMLNLRLQARKRHEARGRDGELSDAA
jgi:uncharacterized membrane protein (DUF2068 family)